MTTENFNTIIALRAAAGLDINKNLLNALFRAAHSNNTKILYSIFKKPIGYVAWTTINMKDLISLQLNISSGQIEAYSNENNAIIVFDVMFDPPWAEPAKIELKSFLSNYKIFGVMKRKSMYFWLKMNEKYRKIVHNTDKTFRIPALKEKLVLSHDIEIEKSISSDLISVVVPVKNNQKGIDRFLHILSTLTDEANYPLEVIIVDNNSDDRVQVTGCYPFPVKVLDCKKLGPGAARNTGVHAANGKWILFTDSDCIATPSLLSGYYSENNDCVAYVGKAEIQGDDPLSNYYRELNMFIPPKTKTAEGFAPWTVVTANCLVLKSAFTAINGFNEKFIYAGGEDTDFGFRLSLAGKMQYNFNSVALHEFKDGINGFINRFVRYGRGARLLDEHYVGDIFSNVAFFPKSSTVQNKFLADTHQKSWDMGYKAEMLIDKL
jgi:glycosyltransferase involved in cell wall biosynthesis